MVNSARTDEARAPFLAQAIAFPADGQHMAVVEQAVEDGGGHHRVAEDLAPLGDVAVAGDQQTATLVAARDELEEQVRGAGLEGQVAQLIDLCGAPHKSINVESSVMWSATAISLFS